MKLFNRTELENLIVLDIETVSGTKELGDNSKRLVELWSKRCEYLRKKHVDNQELTDQEIYETKAGLQAEFGKIICITIGYIRYNDEDKPIIKTKSYQGDDEKKLLTDFFKFVNQLNVKLPNSKFCGHEL